MGFGDQLRCLHATLRGEAAFETLEAWFSLRLVGDGVGHITARGFLHDAPGVGNRLEFALKLDQTDLPAVLAGLDDACRKYPAVDKP